MARSARVRWYKCVHKWPEWRHHVYPALILRSRLGSAHASSKEARGVIHQAPLQPSVHKRVMSVLKKSAIRSGRLLRVSDGVGILPIPSLRAENPSDSGRIRSAWKLVQTAGRNSQTFDEEPAGRYRWPNETTGLKSCGASGNLQNTLPLDLDSLDAVGIGCIHRGSDSA